jgi:hypothetical protein
MDITYRSVDGSLSQYSLDESNTPDQPSYECEEYRAILPYLQLSADIFSGQKAWMGADGTKIRSDRATLYLPKAVKERNEYFFRLRMSRFVNFYRPAIRGFSGLLNEFSFVDASPSFLEFVNNVDLRGNSFAAFMALADQLVLRDGFCGILVNFPKQPTDDNGTPVIQTAEQEQMYRMRPFLKLIPRAAIPNWDHSYTDDGKFDLDYVTIARSSVVADGRFGKTRIPEYEVWEPGGVQVYQEHRDRQGHKSLELVSEVPVSLNRIPLVLYASVGSSIDFLEGADLDPSDVFSSYPPLYDLALLNIDHYQERSDYRTVRYKCNMPVPVRTGLLGQFYPDPTQLPPMILGPNTALDLPIGGDFKFAEPSGVAIEATRQAILDIEAAILRESLDFFGGNTTQQTATEAMLRSSQTRASLPLLAEAKESATQQILELWAEWMQEDQGGTISVDRSLLAIPLSPQAMQVFSSMVSLGQLDTGTFLRILQEGKAIPKDIELDSISGQVGNVAGRPLAGIERSQEPLNGTTL